MYEIIDETLKIASCGIGDLTFEQVSLFLSQWEDGAKIRGLTLFSDPETGYLVLNKDHVQYESHLELVKAYLSASGKELERCRERFGDGLEKTLRVIEDFKEYKNIQSDLNIIDHQSLVVPKNHVVRAVLTSLIKKQDSTCILMSQAYHYGVMNGKRMERARRKSVIA